MSVAILVASCISLLGITLILAFFVSRRFSLIILRQVRKRAASRAMAQSSLAREELFLRVSQLAITALQPCAVIFFTAVLSWVTYKAVTEKQEQVAKDSFALSRMASVAALENQLQAIADEKTVVVGSFGSSLDKTELFRFRNILNENSWTTDDFSTGQYEKIHDYEHGDNWVLVRTANRNGVQEARVSSKSLFAVLLWFRQAQRGLCAGYVTRHDLGLMWRPILAFATHRRFAFFQRYFANYDWAIATSILQETYKEVWLGSRGALPANYSQAFDAEFLATRPLEEHAGSFCPANP